MAHCAENSGTNPFRTAVCTRAIADLGTCHVSVAGKFAVEREGAVHRSEAIPERASPSSDEPWTLHGKNAAAEEPFTAKVKQVQKGLKAFGYYACEIDGVVGPTTKAALEWFQSYFGLKVTGTITPEVFKTLEIEN